ncbi:unnamed protein product [Linum trigynum]|uniref:Uncharacterized protein n=1 Tax=Linum trigynum TaxID=586398 RepID=A0AAV2CEZ4_9ROSI
MVQKVSNIRVEEATKSEVLLGSNIVDIQCSKRGKIPMELSEELNCYRTVSSSLAMVFFSGNRIIMLIPLNFKRSS